MSFCIGRRRGRTAGLLPGWAEAVELVVAAHQAFGARVLVGWDVALLADGPCLVEGNGAPDLDIIQRSGQRPIGNERLGVLLAHHTRRTAEPRIHEVACPTPGALASSNDASTTG